MNDLANEVALLFPQGKAVTIKGEEMMIKPFGFGKFPQVLALMKGFKPPAEGTTASAFNIGQLLVDNADAVMDLVVLATGKKKEWFDDMGMDEGVDLLKTILEVNADFFVKRLQPRTMAAIAELQSSLGAL